MDRGKDKHVLSLLALNPLAIESMELLSGLLAPRQVKTMCQQWTQNNKCCAFVQSLSFLSSKFNQTSVSAEKVSNVCLGRMTLTQQVVLGNFMLYRTLYHTICSANVLYWNVCVWQQYTPHFAKGYSGCTHMISAIFVKKSNLQSATCASFQKTRKRNS